MAQAAPLIIADGQATPVNVTFAPESVTPAASTFADRSSGIYAAYRRVSVTNSFVGGPRKVNRSSMTFAVPITNAVNGVNVLAYTLRANLEFILPPEATDANRKDIYAFVKNALSNALLTGALRDLDPLY